MKKYVYGIDVGGTAIKFGLFDFKGNLIRSWQIPTNIKDCGRHIIGDIREQIYTDMQENLMSAEEVEGVGLGIPGPVKGDGNVLRAVNLGWGKCNIKEEMQNLIQMRTEACNDANAAALGENWRGAGMGYEDVIMVTLGTGVGGGIIKGGKIVYGNAGYGGEIGHIHVQDGETQRCGCGNYGCLEQYASATGMVRIASKIKSEKSIADVSDITCEKIFADAAAGERYALSALEIWGGYLGKGLSIMVNMLDPECIVLGGGVSKAGNKVIELLHPAFEEYVLKDLADIEIKLAELGNNAGIYGAAKLLI